MTEKTLYFYDDENGKIHILKEEDLPKFAEKNDELNEQIADDYNEANLFTVRIADLANENVKLKTTIKEVIGLLEEEVDLFSDKATKHDLTAYRELQDLDNKDAFWMATATKKAIKMLRRSVND